FEGTTAPTMRRATITGLSTQTAVRAGRQQGFDRVVFEFGSGGLPGYTIEYVGRPIRQCGSGNAVSVAGSAWLRVGMTPARAHDDDGQATVAERALSPGLPAVRALRLTCDFEAVLEWVIGVDERKPYRVLELRNPDRLVADILHWPRGGWTSARPRMERAVPAPARAGTARHAHHDPIPRRPLPHHSEEAHVPRRDHSLQASPDQVLEPRAARREEQEDPQHVAQEPRREEHQPARQDHQAVQQV